MRHCTSRSGSVCTKFETERLRCIERAQQPSQGVMPRQETSGVSTVSASKLPGGRGSSQPVFLSSCRAQRPAAVYSLRVRFSGAGFLGAGGRVFQSGAAGWDEQPEPEQDHDDSELCRPN